MAKPPKKAPSTKAPAKPADAPKADAAAKPAATPTAKGPKVDATSKAKDLADRARSIALAQSMGPVGAKMAKLTLQEGLRKHTVAEMAAALSAAKVDPEFSKSLMAGDAAAPAQTAVSNADPVMTKTNLAPVPADMASPATPPAAAAQAGPDMSWMYDKFGEPDKRAIDQFLIDNDYDPDDLDGMTIEDKMDAVQSEMGRVTVSDQGGSPAPAPAAAAPVAAAPMAAPVAKQWPPFPPEDMKALYDFGFTDEQLQQLSPTDLQATLDDVRPAPAAPAPMAGEPFALGQAPAGATPSPAAVMAEVTRQTPDQYKIQAIQDLMFQGGYTIDDINRMDPEALSRALTYVRSGGTKPSPRNPVAGLGNQPVLPTVARDMQYPAQDDFRALLDAGYDAQTQARFDEAARQRALAFVRSGGRAPTPADSPRSAPTMPAEAATTAPAPAVDPAALAAAAPEAAVAPVQPTPSIPDMIARLSQWQQTGTPGTPTYRAPGYMVSKMDEWVRQQQANQAAQAATVSQPSAGSGPTTAGGPGGSTTGGGGGGPPNPPGRGWGKTLLYGGSAIGAGLYGLRWLTQDNNVDPQQMDDLDKKWQQVMQSSSFR